MKRGLFDAGSRRLLMNSKSPVAKMVHLPGALACLLMEKPKKKLSLVNARLFERKKRNDVYA